jgi:acyl-CoA thioesterase FadM
VFVETYRASVAPSECDCLGHMNVQHYFAAVSHGMFALMVRLGLDREEIHRRRRSFAVVRAETDFQAQARRAHHQFRDHLGNNLLAHAATCPHGQDAQGLGCARAAS